MDYAFLSNGLTSALESYGSIDWFPVPRFDSPSVFTKILDENKGGYFSIRPVDEHENEQEYIGYSLILKTTYKTKRGKANVIDFLPISLPAIIRLYDTEIPLKVEIHPVFNYGLINAGTEVVTDKGVIYKNPLSKEGLELLIYGNYEIITPYEILVKSGKGYLYLLYSRDLRYGLFSQKGFVYSKPYEAFSKLINFTEKELGRAKKVSLFKDLYYRSLSVILGLFYKPSGGIIASPTTSLPEIIGEGRNWDYRYVWIRDSSYAIEALTKAGLLTYARRALDFLMNLIDLSSKSFDHPFYTIDGSPPPAEEEINWLSGYKNSKPVRIGNAAYLQVQMDIEGAFMNALYTFYKETEDDDYIDRNFWAVETIATWVSYAWRDPSTDIWEERGVLRHYTHTKVLCWVALDRASKLAKELGYKNLADEWKARADEIKNDVLSKGVKEDHFVRYYNGDEVDAALLTLPIYDFIPADNQIFLNTLKRVEDELKVSEGLYLRYKRDFLGNAVNPFTLVTTWLARIYIRLNQIDKAKMLLQKLSSCSSPLGLIGEHVDPVTCEGRGNFPHLFPHSGVVLAILEMEEVNKNE
ncbi:MAG: alpha,alpha-trehalase TreH2 [Sulfolobaceae archaeon]|jgi:GH15 family glucan-1,4-alpha-glucosidase|nr:alpha,alpha-trehalase TreH2 [Sulfolobaceae archaeon]